MLGSRENQWGSAKSVHGEGEVGDRQTVEGTEGISQFQDVVVPHRAYGFGR